jgi:hypothetical protein
LDQRRSGARIFAMTAQGVFARERTGLNAPLCARSFARSQRVVEQRQAEADCSHQRRRRMQVPEWRAGAQAALLPDVQPKSQPSVARLAS